MKIYKRLSTQTTDANDVERYLVLLNGQVGRGDKFRGAAHLMGWVENIVFPDDEEANDDKPKIKLLQGSHLSQDEVRQVMGYRERFGCARGASTRRWCLSG